MGRNCPTPEMEHTHLEVSTMRRATYFFLALCLCLPMVGCGGDAATTTPAASESTDAAAAGSAEKTEDAAGSEAKADAAAE